MQMDTLNEDVVIKIFKLLDDRNVSLTRTHDIAKCRQVCGRFKTVIDQNMKSFTIGVSHST
jgi:hypothetical protein